MARKNKPKRRAAKQRNNLRSQRDKKSNEIEIPNGFSTPILKMFEFDNPMASLTEEQRLQFAKSIGETATKDFDEKIAELRAVVCEHNPMELLATTAVYCLHKGVGPGTEYTEDGPYTQAIVELIQSICLMHSFDEYGDTPVFHQLMFQALDLSKECSSAFTLKRMTSLAESDSSDRGKLMAMEGARLHTQGLRNWGYPQHMRQIERDLYLPLEDEYRSCVGISPIDFLDLADKLSDKSCKSVVEITKTMGGVLRERNLRTAVGKFCELTGVSKGMAAKMYDEIKAKPGPDEYKRFNLVTYFHQFIPRAFVFTAEDAAAMLPIDINDETLETILDSIAFEFGDFAQENPEHLVMQSKIRTRPLIKLQKATYFLPLHGLVNSFFVEIIETWTKPHPALKTQYHDRRSVYLETALKEMLDDAFPGCLVRTGTTWMDAESGKHYENDCLVVCGPLALVFEAKSESVDDSAKRGAPKTLADHYERLVSEPAEQASRLAKLLEEGQGIRKFQTKKHGEYELDLSTIRRAVCVSVTLDWMPATTLCWRGLEKAGLVPEKSTPAINLSLADLIVVLEALQSPAIRAHYFWRRTEWELRMEYLADEFDLLVYYLSHGLVIPRKDNDETIPQLMLYGVSDELHRHYMAAWVEDDIVPPLPKRIMTPWWSSIIKRVETIDFEHRWDIACVLLDLKYERQREFEMQFKAVVAKVKREGNGAGVDSMFTYADHTESFGAVVAFAYRDLTLARRNECARNLAGRAMADCGAERIVVIGRDVVCEGEPYDFLAYFCDGDERPSDCK